MTVPAASSLLAGFPDAYRDVVNFLARRTGNADDARELAHDVWVRLAEREKNGCATEPADPRAYLFTIAQNIAFDHLRKRRLMRDHAALLPDEEALSPDIAESLMYRQVLAIVDATLSNLPERTREAFVQHRMHGAGQAELAGRFGVSRNTIERDVMTATDAVQSALEAWHDHGSSRGPRDAPRKNRRRAIAALFGVLATVTTGTVVWRWWRENVPQWQAALSTPRGTQSTHRLPDGSSVTLDADSELAIRYTGAARTLQLLRGAAYFVVTRDMERPFSVQVSDVRVVVTGTRFGVDMDSSGVSVQVEQGSVRVEAAQHRAIDLGPGDELRIEGGSVPKLRKVQPEAFTSWRNGELVFADTPLADALDRLARYGREGDFRVQIATEVVRMPVSGRVNVVRAREWIAALPMALPVRVETASDGRIRIDGR